MRESRPLLRTQFSIFETIYFNPLPSPLPLPTGRGERDGVREREGRKYE